MKGKPRSTDEKVQALEGIRILDWSSYYAGPGGPALLGDMGAEVIFIEEPGSGEPARGIKLVGGLPVQLPEGRNLIFEAGGRNKKSVTIDLRTGKGREIVYRLAKKSDVFFSSYRDHAVEDCGMDKASLKRANPRIIYARVSGYGPKGPYSQRGAFDFMIQGHSSMMLAMGEPEMPPMLLHFGALDQACATMAAHAIILALYVRDRLGIVQDVHTSILGTATWLLYLNMLTALLIGKDVPRHSRTRAANPLRNYYRCADGRWLIGSHVPPDRWWPRFCKALEMEELENDPRFKDEMARAEHAEEFVSILDRVFATKPRDEWLALAEKHDLIISPVYASTETVNDDQITANEYVTNLDHQALGTIRFPGYCSHFSETPVKTRRGAPKLGEHTEEVLTSIGGYSMKQVSRLREERII